MWMVARTKWSAETLAARNLNDQGFDCYLPRYFDRGVIRNLFPRYLFVAAIANWRCIFGTRGVQNLLMNDGIPSQVEDFVVDGLRSREEDGLVKLDSRSSRFAVGDKVAVLRGHMKNKIGFYQGMSARQREMALFEFMGRRVAIEFEDGMLSSAAV